MKKFPISLIMIGAMLISLSCQGQAFKYTPKNPSFGGNTFNYSWLLSSAQSQDTFKDPNATSFDFGFNNSPLDDFNQNLNRQLLGRLSQEVFQNQFGSSGLKEGTFELGGFQVEVKPTAEGLAIKIIDIKNGGETQVVVPFF